MTHTPLPTLAVIVCIYNESRLLPFFIQHYHFADKLVILLDTKDTECGHLFDKRWADVRPLNFPDGFSDGVKIEAMKRAAASLTHYDWVLYVDADEFVWPEGNPTCSMFKQVLQFVGPEENVVQVGLKSVFRHESDRDLNILGQYPVLQRRHGIMEPLPGYTKPSLIRPKSGVTPYVGHHNVDGPARISRIRMAGSHWDFADPSIAVERIIKNRIPRIGEENKKHGWGIHYNGQTEAAILEKCRQHLHDPVVVY